jgi:hypothetical protein
MRVYKTIYDKTTSCDSSLENTIENLKVMLEEGVSEGESVTIKVVEMTEEELNKLPEFEGW